MGAVFALLTGCGALVGVQDLEVVGEPTTTAPDSSAPVPDGGQPPADTGAPEDGAPPPPTPRRPPTGSYVYTITGSDELKGGFSSKRSYDGKKATLTIANDPDDERCFTQTFHYRDGYDETMHLCLVGDDYVQDKGTRDQRFDFGAGAATQQECKPGDTYYPAALTIGQSWPHSCTGGNQAETNAQSGDSAFTTAGTYTYAGQEQRTVATTNVEVLRFDDKREVTGAQTGRNDAVWYLAVKNGLLVRLTRDIQLTYPSFIGTITYIEKLDMTLDAPP